VKARNLEEKMNSIVEAVAAYAGRPDRTGRLMLADASKSVTYGEGWARVMAGVSRIRKAGLKRGDRAMIVCTQDVDYMIAMLACQLAGIICVPLEKGASESRVRSIFRETEVAVLIGKKPDLPTGFLRIDEFSAPPENAEACAADFGFPEPEDLCEILFTTGTTGTPKGILLTHRANTAIAENVIDGVHMEEDNVEIIPMPLSHSHGLRRTYANLYNGSSVVLSDGVLRMKKFFELLETYHARSIDISPAILSMLFRLSGDRIADYRDQIRYVQLGSAPLPEADKERLSRCLPDSRLYNFYGTTEAGCSCILDFQEHSGIAFCIGRPTKNAQFIFTDKDRREISATKENPGFIATAGLQNMSGYLNDPEKTAEVCRDGYIFTNDLGYADEDGNIYCLGRQDDVINCGGIKIAPEEIETVMRQCPGISDCACIPVPDKVQGQVPKLYISVKDPDSEFDMPSLHRFMRSHLDSNKVPREIEIIDRIPRTSNGKIRHKELIKKNSEEA
jgi:acyl-CoA synthetase (AMP-forming)/AMP-acid ligase II